MGEDILLKGIAGRDIAYEQEIQTAADNLPPNHREWSESDRQIFIKNMRFKFCRRPEFKETENMLNGDGSFNDQYFVTQIMEVEERKWTDKERSLLIEGITRYGIGCFGEISSALLPDWTANELRVKAMHIMGRQNLSAYKGFKGSEADMMKEFERNRKIGLATGCWKGGVLVTDDNGEVQRMIDETEGTAY